MDGHVFVGRFLSWGQTWKLTPFPAYVSFRCQSACQHVYHLGLTYEAVNGPQLPAWTANCYTQASVMQEGPRCLAKLPSLASMQNWKRKKWGCSTTCPRVLLSVISLLWASGFPSVKWKWERGHGLHVLAPESSSELYFWGVDQVGDNFQLPFGGKEKSMLLSTLLPKTEASSKDWRKHEVGGAGASIEKEKFNRTTGFCVGSWKREYMVWVFIARVGDTVGWAIINGQDNKGALAFAPDASESSKGKLTLCSLI